MILSLGDLHQHTAAEILRKNGFKLESYKSINLPKYAASETLKALLSIDDSNNKVLNKLLYQVGELNQDPYNTLFVATYDFTLILIEGSHIVS